MLHPRVWKDGSEKEVVNSKGWHRGTPSRCSWVIGSACEMPLNNRRCRQPHSAKNMSCSQFFPSTLLVFDRLFTAFADSQRWFISHRSVKKLVLHSCISRASLMLWNAWNWTVELLHRSAMLHDIWCSWTASLAAFIAQSVFKLFHHSIRYISIFYKIIFRNLDHLNQALLLSKHTRNIVAHAS